MIEEFEALRNLGEDVAGNQLVLAGELDGGDEFGGVFDGEGGELR